MKITIVAVLLLFQTILFAQTSSPVFQIGGSANYYYGQSKNKNEVIEFDNSRLLYSLDAALGFQTFTEKGKKNNVIGVFGKIGFIPIDLLQVQFDDLNINQSIDTVRNNYDFMELEFGFISNQVFRLSLGYGWLNSYDIEHNPYTLNYFCSTVGLSLPVSSARINLLVTAMRGRDFDKFVFRPSVGLIMELD